MMFSGGHACLMSVIDLALNNMKQVAFAVSHYMSKVFKLSSFEGMKNLCSYSFGTGLIC